MSAADKRSAAEAPPIQVPCPNCRQPALFAPANRWRPFCSERCRMIDLGAWANESYRVAAAPRQEDDDDLPEPAPPARPS